jgi:two-component system response regulator BaeR
MSHAPILIVEDEIEIAKLLADYLKVQGYETQHFESGEGVIDWLKSHEAACVLLDIMLPQADQFGDGLSLCKDIRALSAVPIMMLTARIEEIDRILGLELGADDYVCKPFSPREVVARVKALIRRAQLKPDSALITQGWKLDEERFLVHYQGQSTEVSAVEFEILRTLSRSPGRIFSRAHLIDAIYHDHRIVSDRTIDSHIKKLRQKLNAAFGEVDFIQSVYGVGYKFSLD